MNNKYEVTVKLNHNEVPARLNKETGEVIPVNSNAPKVPKDKSMEFFKTGQSYTQVFTKAWNLLETQTTDLEFKVAYKLALKAKAYTNSLEPLSPESSLRDISAELKVSHNSIKSVFDKLFKLGVIGKFEVY